MKIHHFLLLGLIILCSSLGYAQNTSEPTAKKVPNINSKVDDYGPCISKNGLTIYFSSSRFSGKSHIYMSKRKSLDAPWSEPEYSKITPNPQDIFGGIALDDVGRFYFSTNRETRTKGDINIWEGFGLDSSTTIRTLPPNVNSYRWESQPSVTKDGKDLYFASNRESPDGSVEMLVDIFVTHRNPDDTWSDPQNLGSQINFGVYNSTPYISPDGRFLFYASKEKQKGVDVKRKIYMSEHIGPKSTDWSKAVLLPSPINSDKDDMFPMITRDGKTIYFSSNRDGGSALDIYEATLPIEIQTTISKSFSGN